MTLLRLEEMSKMFGGLVALNDLTFDVEAGSIVGLIGPNGAGKTTVFNCITGNYTPEAGRIFFDGQSIAGTRPHKVVELGIARTFQTIRLFGRLNVLENVLAGRHCRMKSGLISCMLHTPAQKAEEKAAVARCMEELHFVGLADKYTEAAGGLSYGNQRLLEIARALASDPEIIYFDEPTSALDPELTGEVLAVMRQLAEEGMTMLVVTHEMGFARNVSSKTVFMENGVVVEQAPSHEFFANPKEERTREFLRKIAHTE